ncbi:MAG: rhodanese-like domain-containing protein [Bacteroidetes bacterium]|nr:rhodanese-like domain-containing protein [Bacteroidota bacterium]
MKIEIEIPQLSVAEFEAAIAEGYQVIDLRNADEFCAGFIPDSINFSGSIKESELFKDMFDPRIGVLLVDGNTPQSNSMADALSLIFPSTKGRLNGGFEAWRNAGKKEDIIISIPADEFAIDLKYDEPHVVDIRPEADFEKGHIEMADNTPATTIIAEAEGMPDDAILYFCDDDGALSSMLISWLRRYKLFNIYHLSGGWEALKKVEAENKSAEN